jgi:hypothetical protein
LDSANNAAPFSFCAWPTLVSLLIQSRTLSNLI